MFEAGVNGKFTKDLLKESVNVLLIHSAKHCKWDSTTKVLTTTEDTGKEKEKKIEHAAWYSNTYGDLMAGEKGNRISNRLSLTLRIYTTLTAPTLSSSSI